MTFYLQTTPKNVICNYEDEMPDSSQNLPDLDTVCSAEYFRCEGMTEFPLLDC